MRIDDTLQRIGEFGRFQKRIYALLTLPEMTSGAFCMMLVILLYTPKHRCKIPGFDQDTFTIQGDNHSEMINKTIPQSSVPGEMYDRCTLYVSDDNFTTVRREKCSEWVYDETAFYNTYATINNYVCDSSLKTSHIQMIFYFGLFVGDFVLGMIADSYGRKVAFYLGMWSTLVMSIAVSWAPEFFSFAILQFIIGGGAHGAFVVIAVIVMEMNGPKKRMAPGMFIQATFAVGICYLGLMSYLIRTWRWINLSCALPCVIYIAYWWLIPETPRWLLSKGRQEEGVNVLKRVARVNGHGDVNPEVFDIHIEHQGPQGSEGKVWHVLQTPNLRKRFFILAFNWMIITMTYYGVTLNAGNLGGDFHLNFFLLGLAEIVGTIAGILVLNRIGRRWTNAGSLILAGLACIATVPCLLYAGQSSATALIILSLLGKAMSATAFGVVYIFSAELMPTVVRNAAMGVCSCAGRVGSMLAPYIAKLGDIVSAEIGPVVPLIVFGVLSVFAGSLLLLLPETLNQILPDTLDDGENFGRKKLKKKSSVNIDDSCDSALLEKDKNVPV